MNFNKESKPRIFFFFFFFRGGCGGGGGGGGGGEGNVAGEYEHKCHHIFYTRHIVTTSSTELYYSLVKIFLMVFKIEGIVALTIKGS